MQLNATFLKKRIRSSACSTAVHRGRAREQLCDGCAPFL
jgi:hypothetical protein